MYQHASGTVGAPPHTMRRAPRVDAPGVSSRGARRIVCGGKPRTPDACWYSSDHYQSFVRIVE